MPRVKGGSAIGSYGDRHTRNAIAAAGRGRRRKRFRRARSRRRPLAIRAWRLAKRAARLTRGLRPELRVIHHPNENGRLGLYSATTLESYDIIPHLATTATGLQRAITAQPSAAAVSQAGRIGNAYLAKYYQDVLEFVYDAGTAAATAFEPVWVRVLIYQQPSLVIGTPPGALNILAMIHSSAVAATVDDQSSIVAPYRSVRVCADDQDRGERFRVLYDHRFSMTPAGERGAIVSAAKTSAGIVPSVTKTIRLKLMRRIFFTAATDVDASNPIRIAMFASRDHTFGGSTTSPRVKVRHTSRLYFTAD